MLLCYKLIVYGMPCTTITLSPEKSLLTALRYYMTQGSNNAGMHSCMHRIIFMYVPASVVNILYVLVIAWTSLVPRYSNWHGSGLDPSVTV